MANVEMHQLSLRSEILGMMSEFSEEEIQANAGRDALSSAIAEAINKKLTDIKKFIRIIFKFFGLLMELINLKKFCNSKKMI